MSRDNPKLETAEPVANAEAKTETSTPRKVHTPEELRKIALERRSKSIVHGSSGPIRALGHLKHVPEGFSAMYINPKQGECDKLYARGYDFVKDENGKNCYLQANRGRDAEEHGFPLMMAPDEIVEEEKKVLAKESKESARGDTTHPGIMSNNATGSKYFDDLGLSEEII